MGDTSLLREEKFYTIRKPHMAEKVVFVDGQEGCGKTLFSSLISAFDRVEKLTYSYVIEYLCALHYLHKIDTDSVVTMVRMITDLIIYNTMMSRDVNCRPSDLSSIFKDINTFRYIKRFFMKGDMAVSERIKSEKPILSLTVHKFLAIALPVFEALEERLVFIEIVRHPLYMIIQQTLNNEILLNDARDFGIYIKYNQKEYPWYTAGWEDLFETSNPVEKSVYHIKHINEMTEISKEAVLNKYNAIILTIPFEKFVIEPWPYMKKIEDALETKITNDTLKMMKKQKVPRKMFSEGIPLAIYRRCGWEPPQKGSTEKEEFQYRRDFAAKKASPDAMNVLDKLCSDYEQKYMGNVIIKGDHYV